jgi:hypothetical protein
MVAAGLLIITTPLWSEEPKRNPWRSSTGLSMPEPPAPPQRIDFSRYVPKSGPDRSLEKGLLELVEATLEGELDQLRFQIELRDLEGLGKQFKTEALKREAEFKAEELILQVRGEAAAAHLKESAKAEIVARAEVERLKALKERPEDGSYRKALTTLDDAKLRLSEAKCEYVRVQVVLDEQLNELRRKAERARAESKDPEKKIREKIETTRALLSSVRIRIEEIRYGVGAPALSEATLVREIVQQLRSEVKKMGEGKQK